jgi:exodeoxyribonuclease VII small subunit
MSDELELDQYEVIMARLEDIVKRLEAGRAPLGESLRLYQEAKALSEKANQLLLRAEAVIAPQSQDFEMGDA